MKHYKNALPNTCDFLFRLRASCVFITCVFTDLLMLKSLIVKLFVFMIYIHSSYCLFDNCVFCDLPRPSPINFPKIFLLKLGHEDKIIFRLKNYSFNTLLFLDCIESYPFLHKNLIGMRMKTAKFTLLSMFLHVLPFIYRFLYNMRYRIFFKSNSIIRFKETTLITWFVQEFYKKLPF